MANIAIISKTPDSHLPENIPNTIFFVAIYKLQLLTDIISFVNFFFQFTKFSQLQCRMLHIVEWT